MSPVGSCAYTVTAPPELCAFASGAARFTVVPAILEIVATSACTVPVSRMIVSPGASVAADATVMLVAPAEEAAARVVLPVDRVVMAVVFSSSAFGKSDPPMPQSARGYGDDGLGVVE